MGADLLEQTKPTKTVPFGSPLQPALWSGIWALQQGYEQWKNEHFHSALWTPRQVLKNAMRKWVILQVKMAHFLQRDFCLLLSKKLH